MNELETFLETPDSNEAAVTTDAPASAEATTAAKEPEGKGAIDAATPAAVTDESTAKTNAEKHWSESAYHDEKRKRQELQRELDDLKKPQQQEKPDLFVDPDGFVKGVEEKIAATELKTRINLSRAFMVKLNPDYAEKEARFIDMVKADPSLVAKMNASAMPAEFAYQTAANAMEQEAKLKLVEEMGDPVAYREKLKAEILAEMGAEPAKPVKPALKAIVEKAPSLATASAAGSNTAVTDDSLESLFNGK
jgi:hypothetical protein